MIQFHAMKKCIFFIDHIDENRIITLCKCLLNQGKSLYYQQFPPFLLVSSHIAI